MREQLLRSRCGRPRRRRRLLAALLAAAVALCVLALYRAQISIYADEEREGPLDHLRTALLSPLYRRACPRPVPRAECDSALRTPGSSRRPKIFMISARRDGSVNRTVLPSWDGRLEGVIDTYDVSKSYPGPEGDGRRRRCRAFKWAQRLFYVYRTVYARTLEAHPDDDGFVFVEDDVTLLDWDGLRAEMCLAVSRGLQFYSFFETEKARTRTRRTRGGGGNRTETTTTFSSCVYRYGTVAHFVRREMMERIVRVADDRDDDTFCRLPIDIYIASIGPWYKISTGREVVRHTGTRVKISRVRGRRSLRETTD